MSSLNLNLPSNRKFGFFFSFVLFSSSAFLHWTAKVELSYITSAIGALMLIVTVTNADLLLPFNKLWMRLGLLLGALINPIIMGSIFFSLFAPFAIVMRIFGRDELHLRFRSKSSHWIFRGKTAEQEHSFKNQF